MPELRPRTGRSLRNDTDEISAPNSIYGQTAHLVEEVLHIRFYIFRQRDIPGVLRFLIVLGGSIVTGGNESNCGVGEKKGRG